MLVKTALLLVFTPLALAAQQSSGQQPPATSAAQQRANAAVIQSPASEQPVATIRVNSRLIVLDVTVNDGNGHSVNSPWLNS
jgi:hypothetical protein